MTKYISYVGKTFTVPISMQPEGVWELGAEEDIWTEERWGDRRMEKTA
jgi:hypothetical protein